MRNRLMLSAVTAGLFIVATAATAAAAGPARNTPGSGALTTVTQAPAPARAVVLLNGDRIMAAPGTGRSIAVRPAGAGLGGSLLTFGAGGETYEIPAAAVPFLGRGLDPSLFNVGGLLRKERGGRVPVRVAYRGAAGAARCDTHPGRRWVRHGVPDRVVGAGVRCGAGTPVRGRSLPGQLWTRWHVLRRRVGQPGRDRPGPRQAGRPSGSGHRAAVCHAHADGNRDRSGRRAGHR